VDTKKKTVTQRTGDWRLVVETANESKKRRPKLAEQHLVHAKRSQEEGRKKVEGSIFCKPGQKEDGA
jgi:hypothetical protein